MKSPVRNTTPWRRLRVSLGLILVLCAQASHSAAADEPPLDVNKLKTAITKSIALVEKSAGEYRQHRQCFACHHQAAPVLMLAEARSRGFAIDEKNFDEQLDHTAKHLKRGEDTYRAGQGQGGKADTAGWGLWTLETGGRKPDDVTAAVTHFLLAWQKDRDHWRVSGNRPPTEASDFSTTYVALRGLSAFGTDEQKSEIASQRTQARKWLTNSPAKDTEDRVYRLRSLYFLEVDADAIAAAAKELLEVQAEDGGWPQTKDMTSDGYATGTALVALHETGQLSASDAAYRKGVEFLLRTQLDDGSWHVTTRSKPFQEYFESGFPHGKDQFISVSATCWATSALLLAHPAPSPSEAE